MAFLLFIINIMKTLYIYSNKTGISRSEKKDQKIIQKLKNIFGDLDVKKTNNLHEFEDAILSTVSSYDNLIISGGDGTLKFAVNVLMKIDKEKRPRLGYIPAGTVNDAGKAFGCGNTIGSGLRNLARNKTTKIDVVKVNDEYINFVVAIGAFSDISYSTKRGGKKVIGRLAYYFDALPRLFKKQMVEAHIVADGKVYDVKTPFVLIMNSRNVGGFPVNFGYSINDGLVDIYLTKPGILNGLFHYLFFKVKTQHIRANHVLIKTNQTGPWCLDGEAGFSGDIELKVLKQELEVIGVSK